MAIYKLPLDDELDADIINWIASFPRNKKSEVVRHALRFYMNESKEQEQVFIVTKTGIAESKDDIQQSSVVEEVDKPVFSGKINRIERKPLKKAKRSSLLDDDDGDVIPDDALLENLK